MVDKMAEDSNDKLEKRFERRDFLRFLGIGAAGLAASCVPIDQEVVQSGFPAKKVYEIGEEKPTHNDKVMANYLGFSPNDITSKKEIRGGQVVARLKQDPSKYGGRSVLVTVTKDGNRSQLDYVFEGDRVAFKEISYLSIKRYGESAGKGHLYIRTYENKNGRVKQPLPAEYSPNTSRNLLQWSVVLTLHKMLESEFQRSIFSEDDVKEAKYHINPRPFLNSVEKEIDDLGLDADYESIKDAKDHSSKAKDFKEIVLNYSRITQNSHEEKEINDWVSGIKARLKRVYNNLAKVYEQSGGEKRDYIGDVLNRVVHELK